MPADAPTAFTCARVAVETAPGEYALRAERATLELQPLSLSVKAAATPASSSAPPFHFPLRDVVLGVRADEAHHRDVNHGYANALAGLPPSAVAPCPPHQALEPAWKQAA